MLDIEVRAKWSASILLTLPILVMPTLDQQVMCHDYISVCLFVYIFVCCLFVYLFVCLFSGWKGVLLSGARSVPVYRCWVNVARTTHRVRH